MEEALPRSSSLDATGSGDVPQLDLEMIRLSDDESPGTRIHVTVGVGGRRTTLVSRPADLPFFDGTFDHASLSCSYAWFSGDAGRAAVRELERVLRPQGRFSVQVSGLGSASDGTRISQALEHAGLHTSSVPAPADGGLRFSGTRQIGIDADTWRSLAHGRAATQWNDEMFRFQRTPYDRTTVAGRIFLKRVHWIAQRIGEAKGARILEVGCEAGGLLRHLSPHAQAIGLDLSRAALDEAKGELSARNVCFIHADATRPLPLRDEIFDYVIASEVLEHCRSPRRVIANMHRVLKADGRAIISVPNERRYLQWKRWLQRLPVARLALRGIEEGPAAWHIHHDFDSGKLAALIDGFFTVERSKSVWGTTLIRVLRKIT